MKNSLTLTVLSLASLLAPAVHAAIFATFAEFDAGVRISFDGTLLLDPEVEYGGRPIVSNYLGSESLATTVGINDSYVVFRGGSVSDAFAGLSGDYYDHSAETDGGYFGYARYYLYFLEEHITAGTRTAVEAIAVSGDENYFVIPDETLTSLGLDAIANDSVLWTADGTGDTIRFAVAAVPEPSTVALWLGLGSLGVLVPRRMGSERFLKVFRIFR